MAVEACENAVLASFRANPAHRSHDLVFDPQARKSVPVRSGQLAVTGMGSYASTADRLVRVNYTCSYDVKAEVVLNSSFR
jgi:hypothetical protein